MNGKMNYRIEKIFFWIGMAFVAVVIIGVIVLASIESADCEKRGGTLIRGRCIDRKVVIW